MTTDSPEAYQDSFDALFRDVKRRAHKGSTLLDHFSESDTVKKDTGDLFTAGKSKVDRVLAAAKLAFHALEVVHDHLKEHKEVDSSIKAAKEASREFFEKCKDHPEYSDILLDVVKEVRGNTDVFLSTHGDFAKDKTIQTKMEVDWAKGVEGSVKKGLEAIETRQSATKSASEFQVAGGHKDGRAEAETKL